MPYTVESNHLRLSATLPNPRLVILSERHHDPSAKDLTERTNWRSVFVPESFKLTPDITVGLERLATKGWTVYGCQEQLTQLAY